MNKEPSIFFFFIFFTYIKITFNREKNTCKLGDNGRPIYQKPSLKSELSEKPHHKGETPCTLMK